MADNEKYLKPLQAIAHSHFDMVQDQLVAFRLAKRLAAGGQGPVRISAEQVKALGDPPVIKDGDGFLLDLSNPVIVAVLWMKSAYDAMNLGLFASTDITDSINMINNDNLDHILTDREAMVAVSQVVVTAMNGYNGMKAHIDAAIKDS